MILLEIIRFVETYQRHDDVYDFLLHLIDRFSWSFQNNCSFFDAVAPALLSVQRFVDLSELELDLRQHKAKAIVRFLAQETRLISWYLYG